MVKETYENDPRPTARFEDVEATRGEIHIKFLDDGADIKIGLKGVSDTDILFAFAKILYELMYSY